MACFTACVALRAESISRGLALRVRSSADDDGDDGVDCDGGCRGGCGDNDTRVVALLVCAFVVSDLTRACDVDIMADTFSVCHSLAECSNTPMLGFTGDTIA